MIEISNGDFQFPLNDHLGKKLQNYRMLPFVLAAYFGSIYCFNKLKLFTPVITDEDSITTLFLSAAIGGNISIYKDLSSIFNISHELKTRIINFSIIYDSFQLIRYFYLNGELLNDKSFIKAAVLNRHLDLLKFFVTNQIYNSYDEFIYKLYINSCKSGSVEIVDYVHQLPITQSIPLIKMIKGAVNNNCVSIIKYLFQNSQQKREIFLSLKMFCCSTQHYDMALFMVENGLFDALSSDDYIAVLQNSILQCHYKVIRFILPLIETSQLESFFLNNKRSLFTIMKFKTFKLLIPAIETKIIKNPSIIEFICQNLLNNTDSQLLRSFLDCLRKNNYPMDLIRFGSSGFTVDVLKFLIEEGLYNNSDGPLDPEILRILFRVGSINHVRLFYEKYCPLNKKIIEIMGLLTYCIGDDQLEKIKFLLSFHPNIEQTMDINFHRPGLTVFQFSPKDAALQQFFTLFRSTLYQSKLFNKKMTIQVLNKSELRRRFQILKLICLNNSKLSEYEANLFNHRLSLKKIIEYICFDFLPSVKFSIASSIPDFEKYDSFEFVPNQPDVASIWIDSGFNSVFKCGLAQINNEDHFLELNFPTLTYFLSENFSFDFFKKLFYYSHSKYSDLKLISLLYHLIGFRFSIEIINIVLHEVGNSKTFQQFSVKLLKTAIEYQNTEAVYSLSKYSHNFESLSNFEFTTRSYFLQHSFLHFFHL
jgi:hypothetical protein